MTCPEGLVSEVWHDNGWHNSAQCSCRCASPTVMNDCNNTGEKLSVGDIADFVDIIWQVSGAKIAPAAMQDRPLTCNLKRFQDGVRVLFVSASTMLPKPI